jgi:small subunit ribosomal protein S18
MASRKQGGRSGRQGGRGGRSRASGPHSASRRRSRHLDGDKDIDERDHELLRNFLTEHGKIIPARLTGATAKQQRQIKRGIRRARTMGLLA